MHDHKRVRLISEVFGDQEHKTLEFIDKNLSSVMDSVTDQTIPHTPTSTRKIQTQVSV